MGSVIHGASHEAVKYFRHNPAAMAVYWVYLARANQDNVAWPSVRGLETDTGWNKDTCAKARKWLIEHKALERIADYIRPEWRKLTTAQQAELKKADNNEYYRPTGVLTVGNVSYPMLYHGAADAKPEQQEELSKPINQDKEPIPLSDAVGQGAVRRGGTELNTISEDDTKKAKAEDDSIPLSDAVGQGIKEPATATAFKEYEANIGPITPVIADAVKDYCKSVPPEWIPDAIKEAALHNKRNWAYIKAILDRWQREGKGKSPAKQANGYRTMSPAQPEPEGHRKATPEEAAAILDALAKDKSA